MGVAPSVVRVSSLSLPLVALAACAGADGGTAVRAEPLVNGAPSTEAAVVAVIHTRPAGSRQLCTGTLVAPTIVLTAKHCVFEDLGGTEWVANPPASMSISLGDSVSAPTGEIAVVSIATTPGPYRDGDGAVGGDLALLTLASAPPGIAPARVAAVAPSPGLELRIAGFGYTGAGATGALGDRNAGTASIVSVAAGTFTSEGASWTCTGDSGGPAFRALDGAVLGVTSIGPRGCPASTSIYTRLDVHADLLAAAGIDLGGAGDAGRAVDSGAPEADVGPGAHPDGGAAPPPSSSGCACHAGRASAGGLGASFAVLTLALATLRRRGGHPAPAPTARRPPLGRARP